MSAEIVPTTTALRELAVAIRTEHEACERDYQSAVQHAVRAGQLLLEVKAQVAHGAWLPWLAENFSGSARSAQGYMRLARRADDAQALAHLGIEGALTQLAEPRDEPEPEVVDAEPVLDDVPPEPVEPERAESDPPAPGPPPAPPPPPPERLPVLAMTVREARANLQRARVIVGNMTASPAPDDDDVCRAALAELDGVEVAMAELHADVRRMFAGRADR